MEHIIDLLKNNEDELNQVLDLHRCNSKTLGFLPEQVFKQAVERKQIYIAKKNGTVLGYLLFCINKSGNFLSITHLCVDEKNRTRGLARQMFERLCNDYKENFKGVRATCREDYAENKMWEKLNFTYVKEKQGKKKEGSVLFEWWYNFHTTTLFSTVKDDSKKLKAVLDTNVIFELFEENNTDNESSKGLIEDWLTEFVDFYITKQASNDVSHSSSHELRRKTNAQLQRFEIAQCSIGGTFEIINNIKKMYRRKPSLRDESDIRHLAYTITAGIEIFITKDKVLLSLSEKIQEEFNLRILTPMEFIIQVRDILNENEYQPAQFGGTKLVDCKASVSDLQKCIDVFHNPLIEKKEVLKKKLHSKIVKLDLETFNIKRGTESVLLYTIRKTETAIEMHFIRAVKHNKYGTILTQLIFNIIQTAKKLRKKYIWVFDICDERLRLILTKFGFVQVNGSYVKVVLNKIAPISLIDETLKAEIDDIDVLTEYLKMIPNVRNNTKVTFEIEKLFFPLKLEGINLPCFIIPIKPPWAMNLFNHQLSELDLFGGDETLLFNYENAYYRSASPKILMPGSRVLWYISKGKGAYQNSMHITSSSYINDVQIGRPKELFKQNERLGIYKWNDVLTTAHGDLDKQIMSFLFLLTENFSNNLNISDLNSIFQENLSKNFHPPQTPFEISEELFLHIYSKGMKFE